MIVAAAPKRDAPAADQYLIFHKKHTNCPAVLRRGPEAGSPHVDSNEFIDFHCSGVNSSFMPVSTEQNFFGMYHSDAPFFLEYIRNSNSIRDRGASPRDPPRSCGDSRDCDRTIQLVWTMDQIHPQCSHFFSDDFVQFFTRFLRLNLNAGVAYTTCCKREDALYPTVNCKQRGTGHESKRYRTKLSYR